MNNRPNYDTLYLQSDKLLLSDAFENFKINVLRYINFILFKILFYLNLD